MPFITAENAANLQRLSIEARQARKAAAIATVAVDSYVLRQLARTRRQIDLLNDMLESKAVLADPRQAKAAADAKARLYEVEAALAGRPKPGQYRPVQARAPRQSSLPLPEPADPTVVASPPAPPAPPAPAVPTVSPASAGTSTPPV